jgi:anti-anti-sigma factor
MNLTSGSKNDFCVINIDGRIDTTNFNDFEKEINSILDSGEKQLIFNCELLNYISSSGLRVFLMTQKKITSAGGKLHLCSMQPGIKEIFDISGFSTIFKIFETETAALEA